MRRAFTLLELLLVLVVLGVVTAVAAARLAGLRGTQVLEQGAHRFTDQVVRCQTLSTQLGQTVRLRVDLAAGTCMVQLIGTATAGTTSTSASGEAGTSDPVDGQDPTLDLRDGADALTVDYRGSDGQQVAGQNGSSTQIDLLFQPDGICDRPGILVLDNGKQALAVRCYRLARLPGRLSERPIDSSDMPTLLTTTDG